MSSTLPSCLLFYNGIMHCCKILAYTSVLAGGWWNGGDPGRWRWLHAGHLVCVLVECSLQERRGLQRLRNVARHAVIQCFFFSIYFVSMQ